MLQLLSAFGLTIACAVSGAVALGAVANASTTATTVSSPVTFTTASGTVAAISTAASSMQVQNQVTGQVTVSWTPSTRFTQTVSVPASQLAVGDCVLVTSTSAKSKTGHMTAATVTMQPSTHGRCTGALGFTGAATSGRPVSGRPTSSFPRTTFPSRAATGRFASGRVTTITHSGFVLEETIPVATPKGKATKKPTKASKSAKTKTTKITVTYTAKTSFTTSRTASSSDLVVGMCATAVGPANNIGAIAAATINIRAPSSSGCTSTSF